MNTAGLSERRAAALRALTQRAATPRPSRFPGETPASGDLPEDPELAARMLDARHRDFLDTKVAGPLAESHSDQCTDRDCTINAALAVARQILGTEVKTR
ncbi:hypothetical protein [Streptomyces sp. NPDC004728]|uniref:hypothetical protein n=1 Tax=Streptomyces sp. NPDC004728 TaxID=3154289 RepID=UPI0033BA2A96